MTIEIRELVIRSEVVETGMGTVAPTTADEVLPAALQRVKAEILASCREWLRDQLRSQQER